MTTICVDVMASDRDPEVLLEGVAQALAADDDLSVLVAGAEDVVGPFCESHDRARPLVASEVITMSEHPADAVRRKKDASIVRAASAVRAGDADGLFSAGSTGAVLTAATFGIGRVKGIRRPALASAIPGPEGRHTVFLDLGANADVKPDVLVQFAHMGRAYAEVVLGVEAPTVGLLCNGSEDTKGSALALEYHAALAGADCGFAGNAEGSDLLAGRFDVIVSDGFTANVALKTIEGTAKYLMGQISAVAHSNLAYGLAATVLKPGLRPIAASLSGDAYGGAVLLGLRSPVVKGHGATSSEAVKNGTLACARAVRGGLVDRIAAACVPAR